MIRLTPLREIGSVQALLQEEWLDVLLPMIRRQFGSLKRSERLDIMTCKRAMPIN